MITGPIAQIDLDALRHNLAVCRGAAPSSRLWAVIKADAYGHGMGPCAAALEAADGFAVARVQEALGLRAMGISKPLLVLEGAASETELTAVLSMQVELTVHSSQQLELILSQRQAHLQPRPQRIWLKLDTGMGRLGLQQAEAVALIERLRSPTGSLASGSIQQTTASGAMQTPPLELAGLMTHLANADDPSHPMTAAQCEQARALAEHFGLPLSIGNSAGILAHPAARTDWVRPGIMLYGGSPLLGQTAAALGLRPVMTLTSPLIAVRDLAAGAPIGYGSTYHCPQPMRVGVVAIGYGDGYPRHAPSGTPVLIRGRRSAVLGRVSMDMISIDLRQIPQATVGDPVTLWGQGLPVEEVAEQVGTINYELLCRLSNRVQRMHDGRRP
ncbi:alanine racemase [Halochromatium salexigens]|uniref:Alanine racemase n=1 Tax=Halochromatium salexigens TaxID=49447 RepID=A0AAJ0UJ11_HALSE|nr:alanine racemase [Halochromatium salexigens]MBK5931432.1 alanine racemase [Halochromatium salexigens]